MTFNPFSFPLLRLLHPFVYNAFVILRRVPLENLTQPNNSTLSLSCSL